MVSNPGVASLPPFDAPIACVVESAHAQAQAPAGGPSTAYTRGVPAGTWASGSLPVLFTFSTPLPRDLRQENALAELAVAARSWSEVPCTSFRATVAPSPAALTPGDDGVNGVFFHEDAWPKNLLPGALGQTIVTLDAQGNVHDADIHLNGVDYRWSLGTDPTDGLVDMRGVILHEMGHALGLGHSADPRATMYASHPPGLVWRSLEGDDRAGVCALYPGTGAARCDQGGAACPSPLRCIAASCERMGSRGVVCSPCTRVPGACAGAGDDARCDDLPTGGRVCGRACATDTDCGARMRCVAQTASGDLQCAPTDACASGPVPCTHDEDCVPDSTCRNGACVGPAGAVTDAGTDTDSGSDSGAASDPVSATGGCATAHGSSLDPWAIFAPFVALYASLRRTRSRSPASPSSSRRARRGRSPTSS